MTRTAVPIGCCCSTKNEEIARYDNLELTRKGVGRITISALTNQRGPGDARSFGFFGWFDARSLTIH